MRRTARTFGFAPALAAAALLAACGSSSQPATSSRAGGGETLGTPTLTSTSGKTASAGGSAAGGCAATVANAIGEVGARIYREASSGADVGEAVHRVQSSSALAHAIAANDRAAASAALDGLLAGQIVRIEIVKGGAVFASAGTGTAIAPVRGAVPGTDARFVLSTQSDRSYVEVAKQVTGAEVLLLGGPGVTLARTLALPASAHVPASGAFSYGRARYEVHSLAGAVYPSDAMRIALLVPASASARCAHARRPAEPAAALAASERTYVETLGHVGERIYAEEAGSSYVRATLRHIEADASFQRAVAARDTAAIRAAIVSFFAAHIHVVRVRVYAVERSGAQRFLYDLGGPYVLAPVHGTVRSGGREVGRFSFAIQDDAGYVKLAQRFTGAQVLMRVGARQVMGTLDPGPAHVPDRGAIEYGGRRYEAYSFSGEAFPSGALRISLLVPSRAPIGG